MANSEPDTFHVGGHYIPDGTGGHTMVGQMWVRRYGAANSPQLPVVLIHGGAQTGAFYEQTPDGRRGFAALLADHGRSVYVVDLPGVGRSRYHEAEHGQLAHYSAEMLERVFTAPAVHRSWPQAALHTQWPGTGRMGDSTFDTFFASQVGHFVDSRRTELDIRSAGAALVARIGPCHLVTHSQGAPMGWHIADARPDMICSIVALEPNGPPYYDVLASHEGKPRRPFGITAAALTYDPALDDEATTLPFEIQTAADGLVAIVRQTPPTRQLSHLEAIPVLVVTAEASYHAIYDDQTVDFLRQAGLATDHVRLADHDIRGNGHLMTLESNNDEIATFIADWLMVHEAGSDEG